MKIDLPSCIFGCLVALACTDALATTFTVNALTDMRSTLGGLGSGTSGDLRYCLTQAGYGPAGASHTITFAVTGKITLAAHELVINSDVQIEGPGESLLTVDGDNASRIMFIASGHNIGIAGITFTKGNGLGKDTTGTDPTNPFIGYGGAIYNDRSALTLRNCTFTGNFASQQGGALFNNADEGDASITAINCKLNNNSTGNQGGGCIYNFTFGLYEAAAVSSAIRISGGTLSDNFSENSDAGAILSDAVGNSISAVDIKNCTISGNQGRGASNGGGAIYNKGSANTRSTLNISDSIISGNSAIGVTTFSFGGGGGAILNGGDRGECSVNLTNCVISGNHSDRKGGAVSNISNGTSTINISNCTLSANSSGTTGGAIYNNARQGTANANINNCTLAGNFAQQRGGAIYNEVTPDSFNGSALLNIANTTICGNSAITGGGGIYNIRPQTEAGTTSRVTLANTLLALNPTGANYGSAFATGASGGYNLSDDATCNAFLTAAGDKTNTPSGLEVDGSSAPLLKDNGGSSMTVALLSTSPAIDAGKVAVLPLPAVLSSKDQRGFWRPVDIASATNASGGDRSDIGAFEFGAADGISGWRTIYFGSPANSGSAADGADSNGNGIPNLLEYALNGNPVSVNSGNGILPVNSLHSDHLRTSFTRPLDRTDLTLRIQANEFLSGTWTTLAESIDGGPFNIITSGTVLSETDTGANTSNVVLTDAVACTDPAHPRRFLRLLVERP